MKWYNVETVEGQTPILIEFQPTQQLKIIEQQLLKKYEDKNVSIQFYFYDKLIDTNKTFEELHIHPGNILIYLFKSNGKEMTESDKIIEMLKLNYTYQQSVIALKRTNYQLETAIELAKQDDLTDCSSESDDESMSEVAPTPHIDLISHYHTSEDEAEDLCSDAYKDSESINQ